MRRRGVFALGIALAASLLWAPRASAAEVTILSPVAGDVASGDVTVRVASSADHVLIGFLSTADPIVGTERTVLPVVGGIAEGTLNTRGMPPSADIYACEAVRGGPCGGPVTRVDVDLVNLPVLTDLEDGDIVTPDTMVEVRNPYSDGKVWLGAGVYTLNTTGNRTLWFVRSDISPFDGGTIPIRAMNYPGPLGGGDYEIRAGGCEPLPIPIWCTGAGTHAKVAIDAPLRQGLSFGTYYPDRNELLIGLLDLQQTVEATVTVTDLQGNVVIAPRSLGTIRASAYPGAEFILPAVGDDGQPLPEGRYYVTVDVDRDSTYAATPLHFHGSETIRVGVDRTPPHIVRAEFSTTRLTLVPDRPVQTAAILVDMDEPTDFTYSLTNSTGDQVWGRDIIPFPDDSFDTFEFNGWWDPRYPTGGRDREPLPAGDYTLHLHARDRFSNATDYTIATIKIRSGHWRYATAQRRVTPLASQTARRTAPCTTLASPARPGWPGSATYSSADRCRRGDGVAMTRHRVRLPATPYNVVAARVDVIGGAHRAAPGSVGETRALTARRSPPQDWTEVSSRLTRHRGRGLTPTQLSGLPSLTWLFRATRGNTYDVKAFVVTSRYEKAIVAD